MRLCSTKFDSLKGTEADREKQSTRATEGCSLSSDDGFVTDCYITPTSENHLYCDEPPNLLPYLLRKPFLLFFFKTGFHFSSATTDQQADWLPRKRPEGNQEKKDKERQQLQSYSESTSTCRAYECGTERVYWPGY